MHGVSGICDKQRQSTAHAGSESGMARAACDDHSCSRSASTRRAGGMRTSGRARRVRRSIVYLALGNARGDVSGGVERRSAPHVGRHIARGASGTTYEGAIVPSRRVAGASRSACPTCARCRPTHDVRVLRRVALWLTLRSAFGIERVEGGRALQVRPSDGGCALCKKGRRRGIELF